MKQKQINIIFVLSALIISGGLVYLYNDKIAKEKENADSLNGLGQFIDYGNGVTWGTATSFSYVPALV